MPDLDFIDASTGGHKLILNHDAAIDEYMSTVLLTTMAHIDLLGVVITNADCIAAPAMETAWKIQQYIDAPEIPISLSAARGQNPFPWVYRGDCIKEGAITPLQGYGPNPDWRSGFPDGDAAMRRMLREANDDEVIMLVTGPLTTLRMALEAEPALTAKIRHLIWMGGAIDVPGNLDPHTLPASVANPYAEWNAFWDPEAVAWIFANTDFAIFDFPLDITNQAAITSDFMAKLFAQSKRFRYSELAYASYELVAKEAFYDMWDVVTTCVLSGRAPEIFVAPERHNLEVLSSGPNQGALREVADGREVWVVKNFRDSAVFYDYVLGQFARG